MCRPRPGREVPRSPEDVQRFYIIMMPTSRKAPVRLMTMGTTKRMPAQGERFWGAVLDTGHSVRPSEHMSLTCAPGLNLVLSVCCSTIRPASPETGKLWREACALVWQ